MELCHGGCGRSGSDTDVSVRNREHVGRPKGRIPIEIRADPADVSRVQDPCRIGDHEIRQTGVDREVSYTRPILDIEHFRRRKRPDAYLDLIE